MASLLTCAATMARAADEAPVAPKDLPRWEWGLGVGAAWLRDYPGSRHYSAYALPVPWITWRSPRGEVGRDGARGILYRNLRSELDFTLAANPPSSSADNPERAGMQKLDAVIETGLRGRWRYWLGSDQRWRLDLRLPVRLAFPVDSHLRSHLLGVHAEPGILLERRVDPHWSWGVSAAIGFAEKDYHQYYYGVSAIDARPTRPAYVAEGGYSGWQVGGRLSWRKENFTGGLFLRIENVAGAGFADSPLVSTDWGYTIGTHASWRLGQSQRTIGGDEP